MFFDRFNPTEKSYGKKSVKMFPLYWFFEFLLIIFSDFYHFCTRYFKYCDKVLCKFLQKTYSIIDLKSYTVTAPRNAAQCAEWSLRETNMGQLAE